MTNIRNLIYTGVQFSSGVRKTCPRLARRRRDFPYTRASSILHCHARWMRRFVPKGLVFEIIVQYVHTDVVSRRNECSKSRSTPKVACLKAIRTQYVWKVPGLYFCINSAIARTTKASRSTKLNEYVYPILTRLVIVTRVSNDVEYGVFTRYRVRACDMEPKERKQFFCSALKSKKIVCIVAQESPTVRVAVLGSDSPYARCTV